MKLSKESEAIIEIARMEAEAAYGRYMSAERGYVEARRHELARALPPGTVVRVVGWLKDRPDELRGVVTDWTGPSAFARVWVQFLAHPMLGVDGLQDVIVLGGAVERQPLVTLIDVEHLEPTAERAPYWHEADRDAGVVEVKP